MNEKRLSVIRLLDKRLQMCPGRESGDFQYLAANIQKEYDLYLKQYKYGGGSDRTEGLCNVPSVPSLSGIIDSVGNEQADTISPRPIPMTAFEEEPSRPFLGKSRRGKSLHNIYRNVANYQEALRKICQRDIVKLAQNRHNVTDMYKDEANWLYQMKTEVARTTYGFAKNY